MEPNTEITSWMCNGKLLSLNNRMISERGLTVDDIKQLIKLHTEKEWLYEKMRGLNPDNSEDLDILLSSASVCTVIEFMLQDVWKFERDIRFHKFWETPHCACPKLDNMDAWGTGYYIIENRCPIHGSGPDYLDGENEEEILMEE
jgi:hypothetical protein